MLKFRGGATVCFAHTWFWLRLGQWTLVACEPCFFGCYRAIRDGGASSSEKSAEQHVLDLEMNNKCLAYAKHMVDLDRTLVAWRTQRMEHREACRFVCVVCVDFLRSEQAICASLSFGATVTSTRPGNPS